MDRLSGISFASLSMHSELLSQDVPLLPTLTGKIPEEDEQSASANPMQNTHNCNGLVSRKKSQDKRREQNQIIQMFIIRKSSLLHLP